MPALRPSGIAQMGNDDPWPWWQEDAQHLGVPMAQTRRGMVRGWGWRWEWGQGQGTMSVGPQQCRELACIQALPPASQVRCRPSAEPGASRPPGDIPPDLWDVEVGVPPLFQGQTRRCRVPRSALVRVSPAPRGAHPCRGTLSST